MSKEGCVVAKVETRKKEVLDAKPIERYSRILKIELDQARITYDANKFAAVCQWENLEDYLRFRSALSVKDFSRDKKTEHLIVLRNLEEIDNVDELHALIESTKSEPAVSLDDVFLNTTTTGKKAEIAVFVSPNSLFPHALIIIAPGHDQFHHCWELARFNLNLVNNFHQKNIAAVIIHNEANQSMRTDHDQMAIIQGFEYRPDFDIKNFRVKDRDSHTRLISRLYQKIDQEHSLYSLIYLPGFKMGVVQHKVESWADKTEIEAALKCLGRNVENPYQIFTETAILIYETLKPGAFEMAGNIAVDKSNLLIKILRDWKKEIFERVIKKEGNISTLIENLKLKLQSFCLLFKIDFNVEDFIQESPRNTSNLDKNVVSLMQIQEMISVISSSMVNHGADHLSNYYHNIGKTLDETNLFGDLD